MSGQTNKYINKADVGSSYKKEKEIERICKTKISEKIKNPFKIGIFDF